MINRVVLESTEEEFAPPTKEIELTVIEDNLFITVYDGSAQDLATGRSKEFEVPVLSVQDVLASIWALSTRQD